MGTTVVSARWDGTIIGNNQTNYIVPGSYAWFSITNRTHTGENEGNANVNGCFTASVKSRGTTANKTVNGCYINVLTRTNRAVLAYTGSKEYRYFAAEGQ